MPALIILHPNDKREIRYNVKEGDEPQDVLFTYVHLMPVEIQRIREAKTEEVQNILRRYI